MTSSLPLGARSLENLNSPMLIQEVLSDLAPPTPISHFETSSPDSTPLMAFSIEDKILARLFELGVIDRDWVVQEPYASVRLQNLSVDKSRFSAFMFDQIAGIQGKNVMMIPIARLLKISCLAALESQAGISDIFIHGSFVPYLLDERALKNFLSDLLQDKGADANKLDFKFGYSDIDVRLTARNALDAIDYSFVELFNSGLIFELISQHCLFEIHEQRHGAKLIRTLRLGQMIELFKAEGWISITALVIFNPVNEERIYFSSVQIREFFELCLVTKWNHPLCVDYLFGTFFSNWKNVSGIEQIMRRNPLDGRVKVNVDSVKLSGSHLPVDLVYARFDGSAMTRMSHQEIRVELLPNLDNQNLPKVRTHLQAVIDLCCGITHWTKEEVNKFDFFAYLFTLTSGRRFPNRETEDKLKSKLFEEGGWNPIDLLNDLLSYNKIGQQSDDFLLVYLLNGMQILKGVSLNFKAAFAGRSVEHPVLKEVARALLRDEIEPTTLLALLQIAGQVSLNQSQPDSGYQQLQVDIVRHLGLPHFKCCFGTGFLMIPIDLAGAWGILMSSPGCDRLHQQILDVCFGGKFNSIPQGDGQERFVSQLQRELSIPHEQLIPHLNAQNEIAKKLARFLLFNQLQIYPDQMLCSICLDVEISKRVENQPPEEGAEEFFLGLIEYVAGNEKKRFARMIHLLCTPRQESLSGVVHELLLLSNEAYFTLGLKWAKQLSIDCSEAVQYFLKSKKILRALRIIELFEGPVDVKWLAVISDIVVHSWKLKGFNVNVQVALELFGRFLKTFLESAETKSEQISGKEELIAIYTEFRMQEIVKVLQKTIRAEQERVKISTYQKLLEEFTSSPSPLRLQNLLELYPEFKEKTASQMSGLFPQLLKKNPKLFHLLMKEDCARGVLKESMSPDQMHELMLMVVGALFNSSFFLLDVLEYKELIHPQIYLDLLEKSVKITSEEQKVKIVEFLKTRVDESNLLAEERRRYFQGMVKLENSRKVKNYSAYGYYINGLLNAYSDAEQVPTGLFLEVYKSAIKVLEAGETRDFIFTIDRLHNFIDKKIVKSDERVILKKCDLQYIINRLTHLDSTVSVALDLAYDYIIHNLWNKNELRLFQTAFFNLVEHHHFDFESKPMASIILSVIIQCDTQEFYADFIDAFLQKFHDKDVMEVLKKSHVHLSSIYNSNAKGKIPKSYLDFLSDSVSKIEKLEDLIVVGPLVGQSFIPPKSKSEFQKIQRNYFAKYFALLFAETGPYAQASAFFWGEIRQIFDPFFGDYKIIFYVDKMNVMIPDLNEMIKMIDKEDEKLNGTFLFQELFQLVITTATSCLNSEKLSEIKFIETWSKLKAAILEKCPFMSQLLFFESTDLNETSQPLMIMMEELSKVRPERSDLIMLYRSLWAYFFTFAKDIQFAPFFEKYAMSSYAHLDSFDRRIYESGTNITYNFLAMTEGIGLNYSLQLKSPLHVEYRILFSNKLIYKEWVTAAHIDKALDNIFEKIVKRQAHYSSAFIDQLIYHYVSHWKDRYPLRCMLTIGQLAFLNFDQEPLEMNCPNVALVTMVDTYAKFIKGSKGKNVSELLELHPLLNAFFNHYAPHLDVNFIGAVEVFMRRLESLQALEMLPAFDKLKYEIKSEIALCLHYARSFFKERHRNFVIKFHYLSEYSEKAELIHQYIQFINRIYHVEEFRFIKEVGDLSTIWHDIFISQTNLIILASDLNESQSSRDQCINASILILIEWLDCSSADTIAKDYLVLLERLSPYIASYASMTGIDNDRRLSRLLRIFVFGLHQLLMNGSFDRNQTYVAKNLFFYFIQQLRSANQALYQQILNNINQDTSMRSLFEFALPPSNNH